MRSGAHHSPRLHIATLAITVSLVVFASPLAATRDEPYDTQAGPAEASQWPQPVPRPSPEELAAPPTPEAPQAPPAETGIRAEPEFPSETPAMEFYPVIPSPAKLLGVPVTSLFPGGVPPRANIPNPLAGSAESIYRGMDHFIAFNCVGCHAPNGGGGMGPSLSNKVFIYGGEPASIYLSIYQGRPNGMPAWGGMLSGKIIWELVAYVESISKAPSDSWGRTISRQTMKIEQVPAEHIQTPRPWNRTEPFGFGEKPQQAH